MFALDPKTEAEYLRLAKNPEKNEKAAQKLVDKAAKKWSGSDQKYFHTSTNKGFTEFRTPAFFESVEDPDQEVGDFASELGDTSEVESRKFFLNIQNPKYVTEEVADEEPFLTNDPNEIEQSEEAKDISKGLGLTDNSQTPYDGWVSDREIVAMSPNQIKLADPFVYDDQGKVIPLSQRFGESSDIRFALDPDQEARDVADEEATQRQSAEEQRREVNTERRSLDLAALPWTRKIASSTHHYTKSSRTSSLVKHQRTKH